jgi:basic membrane protein A
MEKNAMYAIVLIVIIGVAALGIWFVIQPVTNPYNVAIVFATGRLGDKSFNDGCYAGAQKAETDHNINFTYSEPDEIAQYETFHRQYASHAGYIEPFDLIIGVGFDQEAAIKKVAAEYPDQKFAIVDMFIDPVNYSNVASLLFAEQEGSALVGAIASMMTQTGKIGFVGGMDIDLIRKFAAGYWYGANYTTPDNSTEVSIVYVGAWDDITKGKTLANGLYTTGGCDVIFAAAGKSGLGMFEACDEIITGGTNTTPIWCIGVDSPQMYLGCDDPENPTAPTFVLTTMLKKVDVATFEIMKEAVIGTWTGGLKFFNLANGGHGYEVNTALLTLPANVIAKAEELKEMIINGTLIPPTDY